MNNATEKSLEAELLPCPFCGGKATLDDSSTDFYVLCSDCDAQSDPCSSFEVDRKRGEAIKTWNTRKGEAARLKAMVDKPGDVSTPEDLRLQFAECLKQVILGNEYPSALFTKILQPYLKRETQRELTGKNRERAYELVFQAYSQSHREWKGDAQESLGAINALLTEFDIIPKHSLLERESSHPLSFCTYTDGNGIRKFNTDFVPQVIATYETELKANLDNNNMAGAVYNAMETSLVEHILNHIEVDEEGYR